MSSDARHDEDTLVDPDILDRVKGWRPYVEAKLGFRNHWYPVITSGEVQEGKPVPAKLCGENLLLNRIDGKVFAVRDRCLHRGVQFSVKPECHTKDTITCWYHGFTYRFDTGKLVNIVAVSSSKMCDGTRGLRTYAVEEAKGLVFVFMGDSAEPSHPLAVDVPPNFLDSERYVRPRTVVVASNWRHGVENGFDKTHIYIHRDSKLITENKLCLPLGFAPSDTVSHEIADVEGQPRGVFEVYGPHVIPAFEGIIEGRVVLSADGNTEGKNLVPHSISMWIPCALKVDPWPDPRLTQVEWYVPLDETHHLYVQTLSTVARSDAEREAFDSEYENRWVHYALEEFNGPDIWAREAAERAYSDDRQWVDEGLFEADDNIVAFRRLISKRNGGIQRPHHLRDGAVAHAPTNTHVRKGG